MVLFIIDLWGLLQTFGFRRSLAKESTKSLG